MNMMASGNPPSQVPLARNKREVATLYHRSAHVLSRNIPIVVRYMHEVTAPASLEKEFSGATTC